MRNRDRGYARAVKLASIAVVCALFAVGPIVAQAQTEGAPAEAAPDSEEARGLFLAGRAAYDEGRFEDALERFEESYRISGRAELLFNVGLAAERARRDERALEAYEGYLEAVPDSPNRANVEGRIRSIRLSLAEQRALQEQVQASEQAASESAEPAEDSGGVATKWWFWTIVGVVAVGGAVTAGVLATRDRQQGPDPGPTGVVLVGLRP